MIKSSGKKRSFIICLSAIVLILHAATVCTLFVSMWNHYRYISYLHKNGIPTVLYTHCINDRSILAGLKVEHGNSAWGKDVSEYYILSYSEEVSERLWSLEDYEKWRFLPMSEIEYDEYWGAFDWVFYSDELMATLPLTSEDTLGRWYCEGVKQKEEKTLVSRQRYLLIDIRENKTLVYIYVST